MCSRFLIICDRASNAACFGAALAMSRLTASKHIVEEVAEPGFKDGDLGFGHRHRHRQFHPISSGPRFLLPLSGMTAPSRRPRYRSWGLNTSQTTIRRSTARMR
jgi:hypothetical protein